MSNMVKQTGAYVNRKTIMIGQESYYIALPCIVSGTANTVIKAGMPLNGDITKRDVGFTVSAKVEDSVKAVGVNLHDVKLDADGKGNATIVLAGCVDNLKLEPDVVTKLGTVTEGLDRIIFVEGSAI